MWRASCASELGAGSAARDDESAISSASSSEVRNIAREYICAIKFTLEWGGCSGGGDLRKQAFWSAAPALTLPSPGVPGEGKEAPHPDPLPHAAARFTRKALLGACGRGREGALTQLSRGSAARGPCPGASALALRVGASPGPSGA